ncbi:MAG: hypothetical protein AB7P17_07595 [Nitrospirales bacterium]|nr:hypothetical protein [Nitrospirales bacterium]
MDTQNLIRPHNPQGIFLMVMFGIVSLTSLASMALGLENGPWKEPTPGHEETPPIIIEGEVTRVQGEFSGKDFFQMRDQRYVVETPMGSQWNLHLGEHTQKTGDIFLGDQVKASIGKDGLLQTVQKIEQKKTSPPKNSVVRRQITGIVEKRNGNFLYVKQGDHTEILHLDDQSTFEGDIREGTNVVAQLGDAGYAIRVEESK